MLCFPLFGAQLRHFHGKNEAQKCFCPPPCCQLFSGALFFSIWGFFCKMCVFNRGLWWESLFRAFFLGKYAPFFCYVDLLAFSSFVSRYFRATANFNNFSGPIFGALMLCFPAFGENVRFHSGFSFRIWAPVLWCFVFQHLALVCFRFFWLL